MKLCIYGMGGFGKEVYDIALRINKMHSCWDEIFFVVDSQYLSSDSYLGPLFSIDDLLNDFDVNTIEAVVANGEPVVRKKIFYKIKDMNIRMATLIDPTAIISTTARIGTGVIVAPFSSVNSSAVVGDNVAINTHSIAGHDIAVGDHTVISSHVNIGGSSVIGSGSYIGMGAQIKEKIAIGSDVIIGMGSIVFNDIPDKIIAVGNPARPSRRNEGTMVFK